MICYKFTNLHELLNGYIGFYLEFNYNLKFKYKKKRQRRITFDFWLNPQSSRLVKYINELRQIIDKGKFKEFMRNNF